MRAIPVSAHPGSPRSFLFSCAFAFVLSAVLCPVMFGQEVAPSSTTSSGNAASGISPLIRQAIDESQLTTLKGNTYPMARKEFDLGAAPASLPMERMLLVLKHSDAQDAALRRFLDEQQDQSSQNYHLWLTPEEFGQQFGPTDADIQTITNWLQSHGFQVGTTKGRTVLEFSGSASHVEAAFHTEIHRYLVNGELHWANASDPQIPTALVPAVAGIVSLHDFPRKAMNRYVGKYSEKTKKVTSPSPSYTFGCGNGQDCYAVAPYDFAKIYDVQNLWNAGINGTGQTIAIVGRTDINPSDATTFWSLFGLSVPANKLSIITNGSDPGFTGDEGEADIDTQWSGAVAPQAKIDYVTSASTSTTDGVDLSAVYIVENNLAPVMSESYGLCELFMGTAGNQFYNALWGQAAAQGISVFVSAGDNGSAGCDDPSSAAQYGLNVNGIASTPFNAAIGGTDFNQYNTWDMYWSQTNNATTQASALGYIPETTWNDSCTNALAVQLGYGATAEQACNNPQMVQAGGVNSTGGSGGKSGCVVNNQTIGSCSKGYQKPSWQKGTGVPADNLRDLPDVSLFASNGFLNSFYVICQSDQTGSCFLNGGLLGYGGTSVASPAFAGIMALVNQKMGKPQGVPGFTLYQLSSKQANAFHDVLSGSTIRMPCIAASTSDCVTNTLGDAYGVLKGYDTTAGYDLATGLGSVDAADLVNNWSKATFTSTTATLSLNNGTAVNVTHGASVPVSIGISPIAATGNVALLVDVGPGTTTGQAIAAFQLSGGAFSGNTSMLPGGTYNVIAHYGGDGTYGGSYSSSTSVTVNKENSQPQIFLVTLNANGTVASSNTTTAVYGSPYLLRVNVNNSAGQSCNPVSTGDPTACPTGTVTLTDNGTAMNPGTFTLNSYGYFEDQTVQLPGGTNSIQASYSGDASFNASAPTQAIAITPASTSAGSPNVGTESVGEILVAYVTVQAQSSGAAPTGTVTFYINGTAVSGTVNYVGTAGSGSNPTASLLASFSSSASPFTKVGTYTITASYGGDANYGPSTSRATSLLVQYPAPVISVTPWTQTVNVGGTATLTSLVDSSAKMAYPTGSVTFVNSQNGQSLGNPVACVNGTDSSGNYGCAVSFSFNPTSTMLMVAQYSGDANYPSSASGPITVNVPDFSIVPGSQQVTVTQGQNPPPTLSLDVSPQGGFNSAVSFSCSGLPAETSCSFNPATVTGGGSTTISFTTAAVGQARPAFGHGRLGIGLVMFSLFGMCLIGIPAWGRKRAAMTAVGMIAVLIVLPSCGGGGGGQQNNPVPSISSLSPAQEVKGSQAQTVTINGSGFVSSSSVTYNGAARAALYVNASQMSVGLQSADLATTGSFPVVVTNPAPGGGASSPMNFKIVAQGTPTGTYNVNVVAKSGSLSHTTQIQLIVQSQ
jgi:subtilase family serine protease